MSKELLQKALVNVSDGNSAEFMANIGKVFTGKLKTKVDAMVKENEKTIFKKI